MTASILDLVPHRPPMLFVDRLRLASPNHFLSDYHVPVDSPWLEAGELPPEALLEIMAQCFAAGAGYQAHGEKRAVNWGYLAAVRDFQATAQARAGEDLQAECTVVAVVSPLYLVEGAIFRDGEKIAGARFKIFIPTDLKRRSDLKGAPA